MNYHTHEIQDRKKKLKKNFFTSSWGYKNHYYNDYITADPMFPRVKV